MKYLRTEVRAELEPVELAWDTLLRFDEGEEDRKIILCLLEYFRGQTGPWVLMGLEGFVRYITHFNNSLVPLEESAAQSRRSLSEAALDELRDAVSQRLARSDNAKAFLCLTDRYEAHRVTSGLAGADRIHTLDVLKDILGETLPTSAWRRKFDHIYPIELPRIEVRKNLDLLLLDVPARSLAQLPIGFAYVYKAARRSGVNLQAIDVDLVAYHRYHARRCLNFVERISSQGSLHPQDPWQAENYIVWTDKGFVDYFTDILDELCAKIIDAKPKVIGFSLHQTSHVCVSRIVERVRRELPEVCVIVGGMSVYQHSVAGRIFPEADYVVVGEADTMVGPLVAALAKGERPRDLPGVVSRYDTADRHYISAPLPHNLDLLGAPDYSFTNLDWYVNWNGYRLMPVVGSRGCGWSRCTFCAERFNWRARTPERVAEEIKYYTTRGFSNFVFNESDFNSNLSFVTRLCREIVRLDINAHFTAQLRIGKDCDFEYYKSMREAGFTCLRFGIDGLSENTLRLQRKGYTKAMVIENLKHCHALGIFTEINLVIGVPGETEDDVEESADFIIAMKDYIGRVAFINPLMLFVGSVYYFEPERHKIGFRGDKQELYEKYFVSLPDDSWFSEDPYIDDTVRRQRFFRIIDRIHRVGVPLGSFANFTAEYRKRHGDSAETRSSVAATSAEIGVDRTEVPLSADSGRAKTEFQKTFYGSWSTALLSAASYDGEQPAGQEVAKVVRFGREFYFVRQGTEGQQSIVSVSPTPRLLRSFKGYNLVAYRDEILGAPIILGPVDLTQEDARRDVRIIKGRSEEAVVEIIEHIDALRTLKRTPTSHRLSKALRRIGRMALHSSPALLRSYRQYLRRREAAGAMRNIDSPEPHEELASTVSDEGVEMPLAAVPRKINMRAGVLLRAGK